MPSDLTIAEKAEKLGLARIPDTKKWWRDNRDGTVSVLNGRDVAALYAERFPAPDYRAALTPTTDGEREAATSPFVAGTGLMGATEPGQRVTAENAHRLPPGSVVRLDDGGRLIHLHDDLWLWLSSSGAAYCYDRIERFHYCLPASLCHLPVATERAKAADAARERAAIVAWLRGPCNDPFHDVRWCSTCESRSDYADAIERGAHTKVTL